MVGCKYEKEFSVEKILLSAQVLKTSEPPWPIQKLNIVRPEGFERLPQNTGLTQKCKQGGPESGTVVEDSRLVEQSHTTFECIE